MCMGNESAEGSFPISLNAIRKNKMDRDKNTKSYIGAFRHGDHFYEHNIFIADDDRVECVDETGKVILTFTANCDCYTGSKKDDDKKTLGRFSMSYDAKAPRRSENWTFRPEGGGEEVNLGHDLLMGEIEIAKMYLQGKFAVQPA